MKKYILLFLFPFVTYLFSQTEKEIQIKYMFEDMGMEAEIYGMFGALSEMLIASLESENIPEYIAVDMMDYLKRPENIKLFIEMAIPGYDRYFTYNEIIELRQFFNSEIGRKYITMTPILSKELEQIGQEWAIIVMTNYLQGIYENSYLESD